MLVAADRIVIRFRFVLHDPRRVAGFDQVHGFADGFDAEGKYFVEVQRAGGIVRVYPHFFLQQDRAGIDALSTQKIVKPVTVSPLISAQLIALAPRYLGNRDG